MLSSKKGNLAEFKIKGQIYTYTRTNTYTSFSFRKKEKEFCQHAFHDCCNNLLSVSLPKYKTQIYSRQIWLIHFIVYMCCFCLVKTEVIAEKPQLEVTTP